MNKSSYFCLTINQRFISPVHYEKLNSSLTKGGNVMLREGNVFVSSTLALDVISRRDGTDFSRNNLVHETNYHHMTFQ